MEHCDMTRTERLARWSHQKWNDFIWGHWPFEEPTDEPGFETTRAYRAAWALNGWLADGWVHGWVRDVVNDTEDE